MSETKVEAQREPELEKCPLCPNGGKPYFTRTVNGTRMAYVGCSECGLELKAAVIMVTPVDEALSKDIVGIWNTRSRPAEIRRQALKDVANIIRARLKINDALNTEAVEQFALTLAETERLIGSIRAAPTPSKPSTADRDHLDEAVAALKGLASRRFESGLCWCEIPCPELGEHMPSCAVARAVLAKIDAAEKAGDEGK